MTNSQGNSLHLILYILGCVMFAIGAGWPGWLDAPGWGYRIRVVSFGLLCFGITTIF